MSSKSISEEEKTALLSTLKTRFEKNMSRHKGLEWSSIEAKISANESLLWTLNEMDETEGEPDVVIFESNPKEYFFVDCAAESPKGRRSLCYDQQALDSRKEHKPKDSAIEAAKYMGIELLNEEQYRELQKLFKFDTKTSSWILTTPEVRSAGGAMFCDCRYNQTWTYHNGAESYYAARGFRGLVRI